ncbi:DUF368 domain-containing protein [Sporanaerobium hydrogeniformans]|uniref:DUF368 domain-containing protein n=1 Tax=Sporanaerobium hydrogeniformans TaxID=3072179 RepID=A0AC61D7E5_9FIRM|nr:DUF368 domain-containing protein [Sporanaerobium hydrogeniformans]PHV69496.1 DUF368 domain-containing protein [Sporanaerobium hydrogeniformans]
MYIIQFIRGFFMALADSVPGVSGGSIAFIMGFYDEFIDSLNTLVSNHSLEEKKKSLFFLFKLGLGWIVGMVLSIFILASLFEEQIYGISSLFIGFILFSIPLIANEERKTLAKNYRGLIFSILGIVLVVLITYFNPTGGGSSITLHQFSFPLAIYVFFAGMIAISAMVLPGISGSTLLLIFGLYVPVVNAVKQLLTFNFNVFPLLFCFGLGILGGIILTIRGIRYLLAHYRTQMIYFILGLMLGSLYAVCMGPTTLETPQPPMSLDNFNILLFITGGLLIIGLEKVKGISTIK